MDLSRFLVTSLPAFLDTLLKNDWAALPLLQIIPSLHQFVNWSKGQLFQRFEYCKKLDTLAEALLAYKSRKGVTASTLSEMMCCLIAMRIRDMLELPEKQGTFDRIKELGMELFISLEDKSFQEIIKKLILYIASPRRPVFMYRLRQLLQSFQMEGALNSQLTTLSSQSSNIIEDDSKSCDEQAMTLRMQSKDYFLSFFHRADDEQNINSNSLVEYTQKVIQNSKHRTLMISRRHKVIRKANRDWKPHPAPFRRRLRFMSKSSMYSQEDSPFVDDSR